MDQELRSHLLQLLESSGAHINLRQVLKNIPAHLRGKTAQKLHTAWQILEHMRIAQKDILDFMVNPEYLELKFPDDYWPKEEEPPTPESWDNSVKALLDDLNSIKDILKDPSIDLLAKIPHGSGQTILREILLVADHNSHHLGQLAQLRLLLGLSPLT